MSTALFDDGSRGATLSDDDRYRYDLWRRWAPGPLMGWIMLNPSTGDADQDDHTIRKCMGFARRAGSSGIRIVNLFAYRATKPSELMAASLRGIDIVGPANDRFLAAMADDPFGIRPVVAAWGSALASERLHRLKLQRCHDATRIFGRRLQRLEQGSGYVAPHPARLSYDIPIRPMPEDAYAD